MFEDSKHRDLIESKARSILLELWLILTAWCKVAVLFFLIACPGSMRADNVNGIDLYLFEFTSEFYMPMGRGILNGLMASDGSHHRIAIYWIEPAVYHDSTFFLGYSDFIIEENIVHYWIHGVSQHGIFNLSDKENGLLLPRDVSVESVARSALAIATRIRSDPEQADTPLEVSRFFRQSRDKADYSYEVPSEQTTNDQASGNRASDEQILNALPFGRKYSKEIRSDGTLIWRAQRVMDGPHVARVTVKPVSGTQTANADNMFDQNTLGQWTLVPEPYRAYWSFDRAYSKLKDAPDDDASGRELYDKIESYLDNNKVPSNVYPFFNQLWFKTAILTGDINRVSNSVQVVAARLFNDASVSNYQGMLALARIANEIRERYPQQAEELLRPLIGQMVKRTGSDASGNLDKLMTTIENKRWFWYGKLLAEEIRNQALIEKDTAVNLSARLEASRLAKEKNAPSPCELTPTIQQYLTQLDAEPPAGALSMDDVREILEKGLEKSRADANLELTNALVEDVVRSIRMIAGEGPFCGDKTKLIESVEHFSGLYLAVFKYKEPIDTVLATFLALSFCDTSTPEDHDVLYSQISRLITEFQTLTNTMLNERGLSTLVEPNDVERIFSMYEKKFRNYIDDPLLPALKFPLTNNEQTRLRNKLKLRFMQLEPLFKEMSLKLKFRGEDKKLKDETIKIISLAVQQFLPQAAFLRNPPYPGVSCHYQGGYGFTAVIKGLLYNDGERPKEKFKAMKYFHLGHRLEQIVKLEKEQAGASSPRATR